MRVAPLFRAALAVAVVTAAALAAPAARAGLPVNERGEATLAPVIEAAAPAVVNIRTFHAAAGADSAEEEAPFFDHPFLDRLFPEGLPGWQGRERPRQGVGSGVIVDAANGYIVTNHHVVDGADEIAVTLVDGRVLEASLKGSDPQTDIAVLHVEAEGLVELPPGDSDRLRVGDFVVAIGNPFGLGQTVTLGIVSAKGREGIGPRDGYEDFIQTDASINPGNSGGPLISLSGKLVGINTAILGRSNIGIGFAVPIEIAGAVVRQIVEHGAVQRGLLGVGIQTLTPELAEALALPVTEGAIVNRVLKGSAAERAGLREDDVVTAIDGEPVADAGDLRNAVGLKRIGEAMRLDIVRDGEAMTIEAVVETRPDDMAAAAAESAPASGGEARYRGATVGALDPASAPPDVEGGVLVLAVEEGSPAWRAGLRPGDIVMEAARRKVATPGEFASAVEGAEGKAALRIVREGRVFYAVL